MAVAAAASSRGSLRVLFWSMSLLLFSLPRIDGCLSLSAIWAGQSQSLLGVCNLPRSRRLGCMARAPLPYSFVGGGCWKEGVAETVTVCLGTHACTHTLVNLFELCVIPHPCVLQQILLKARLPLCTSMLWLQSPTGQRYLSSMAQGPLWL